MTDFDPDADEAVLLEQELLAGLGGSDDAGTGAGPRGDGGQRRLLHLAVLNGATTFVPRQETPSPLPAETKTENDEENVVTLKAKGGAPKKKKPAAAGSKQDPQVKAAFLDDKIALKGELLSLFKRRYKDIPVLAHHHMDIENIATAVMEIRAVVRGAKALTPKKLVYDLCRNEAAVDELMEYDRAKNKHESRDGALDEEAAQDSDQEEGEGGLPSPLDPPAGEDGSPSSPRGVKGGAELPPRGSRGDGSPPWSYDYKGLKRDSKREKILAKMPGFCVVISSQTEILAPFMKMCFPEFTFVKPIDPGDAHFLHNGYPINVAERKTETDMYTAVQAKGQNKESRFHDQRMRLFMLPLPKTQVRYILERDEKKADTLKREFFDLKAALTGAGHKDVEQGADRIARPAPAMASFESSWSSSGSNWRGATAVQESPYHKRIMTSEGKALPTYTIDSMRAHTYHGYEIAMHKTDGVLNSVLTLVDEVRSILTKGSRYINYLCRTLKYIDEHCKGDCERAARMYEDAVREYDSLATIEDDQFELMHVLKMDHKRMNEEFASLAGKDLHGKMLKQMTSTIKGRARDILDYKSRMFKMLQGLCDLSSAKAYAVAQRYPTPRSLSRAYRRLRGERKKQELLLKGIEVQSKNAAAMDAASVARQGSEKKRKRTTLGPQASKHVFRYMYDIDDILRAQARDRGDDVSSSSSSSSDDEHSGSEKGAKHRGKGARKDKGKDDSESDSDHQVSMPRLKKLCETLRKPKKHSAAPKKTTSKPLKTIAKPKPTLGKSTFVIGGHSAPLDPRGGKRSPLDPPASKLSKSSSKGSSKDSKAASSAKASGTGAGGQGGTASPLGRQPPSKRKRIDSSSDSDSDVKMKSKKSGDDVKKPAKKKARTVSRLLVDEPIKVKAAGSAKGTSRGTEGVGPLVMDPGAKKDTTKWKQTTIPHVEYRSSPGTHDKTDNEQKPTKWKQTTISGKKPSRSSEESGSESD